MPPSLSSLFLVPSISSAILSLLPATHAYIPAMPINDTSGLNLTDSSTIAISWVQPIGVYSGSVSYQLQADVPTGGTTAGALVHFTESTMGPNQTTSTPWIAYISCDVNETSASMEWDIFTLARDRGAVSALLYTANSQSCLLNSEYITDFEKPLDVFATKTVQVARVIDSQFIHTNDTFSFYNGSLLNSSGTAVNDSLAGSPPNAKTFLIGTLTARNSTGQAQPTYIPGGSTGSPAASHSNKATSPGMIVLYVITGAIAFIFLGMIFLGTRRAFQHPERYGRREADGEGGGAQTRAGGVAQAILDTFPIIKFRGASRGVGEGAGGAGPRGESEGEGAKEMGRMVPKRLSSEADEDSVVFPRLRASSASAASMQQQQQAKRQSSTLYRASGDEQSEASGSRAASHHTEALVEEAQGIGEDQCPICLIDFEEGEDLRVLPCEREHVYHKGCIDPWLLQVSSSCPLCRKDFNAPPPPPVPTPPSPDPIPSPPASAVAAPSPPTTSGFPKYLAWMRRHRRRHRSGTVGTMDSGVGWGRSREADQGGRVGSEGIDSRLMHPC